MNKILLYVIPRDLISYIIDNYTYTVPILEIENNYYDKILHDTKYLHVFKNYNVYIVIDKINIVTRKTNYIPDYAFSTKFYKKFKDKIEECTYYPEIHTTSTIFKHHFSVPNYIVNCCAVAYNLHRTYLFTHAVYNKLTYICKYIAVSRFDREFVMSGKIAHINNENNDMSNDDENLYLYNRNTINVLNKDLNPERLDEILIDNFRLTHTIYSPINISKMYKNYILTINKKNINVYNLNFELIDTIFVRNKIKKINISNDALIVKCKFNTFVYLLNY